MNELTANIAVAAATVTTLAFLVPQIVKLVRTGDSAGVSTTWPALGFVSNVGWFVYMIRQELWASTVAPFGMFVSYGITLWALSRLGRRMTPSYLRGVGWTVVLVGVTVAFGWTELGVMLGVSFMVQMAPSLWTAYRTADPSGISPGTWWIGVVEAFLWGYYGLFHEDAGVITFGMMALLGSSLMLARFYATRGVVAEAHT